MATPPPLIPSSLASVAPRPSVTFTHVDRHVVVLTAIGSPTVEHWDAFERGFRSMYTEHTSFVLLFDLREMGFPDMATAVRLMGLVSELKVHSFRQLIAAVVLTSSDVLRELIVSIVRKAGQAAPFYAFSDVTAAVTTAAYLACVERGAAGLIAPACVRSISLAPVAAAAASATVTAGAGGGDGSAAPVPAVVPQRWRDLQNPSITFVWIVLINFARAFSHVMQWARRNGHA